MFDLNPLDILKKREIKFLPPHFSKFKLSEFDSFDNSISDWIKSKLKGRFCLVTIPNIDSSNSLKPSIYVGFEDDKELTYFMLACPHIRRS
jgi:hypothetical protein